MITLLIKGGPAPNEVEVARTLRLCSCRQGGTLMRLMWRVWSAMIGSLVDLATFKYFFAIRRIHEQMRPYIRVVLRKVRLFVTRPCVPEKAHWIKFEVEH
jgi:hypothetical protein